HLFFVHDTPTTEIYTLSLHDALPIFRESLTHLSPVRDPRRAMGGHGPVSRTPRGFHGGHGQPGKGEARGALPGARFPSAGAAHAAHPARPRLGAGGTR